MMREDGDDSLTHLCSLTVGLENGGDQMLELVDYELDGSWRVSCD